MFLDEPNTNTPIARLCHCESSGLMQIASTITASSGMNDMPPKTTSVVLQTMKLAYTSIQPPQPFCISPENSYFLTNPLHSLTLHCK